MSGADGYRDDERDAEEQSGNDNDYGQEPYEADQLALDEADDERLPWLESGEDEYYDDAPDMGRILGMFLLGVVALAAIVGGIWWSTHRTPDTTLVADGGTIKAPAQPYKQAPTKPGGKTFEGTGDTAFAVSEGKSHAARLGEAGVPASGDAARPSVDLSPKPPAPTSVRATASAAARPAATPSAAAAPAGAPAGGPGTLVQVGAYSTRASAEAAWSRLTGQYGALSGQRHQIVEGQADIGTVFRLQALPGSASAAHALCGRLKGSGLACQVK